MAGIETAAGVYGLITGTITIIDTSIQIYEAVRDKSGITKELRKVSAQLPSIKELLRDATAQYDAKKLDDQQWVNAASDVKQCNAACQELQDLLNSAYPEVDTGPVGRVFKNLGNIVSRKGKTAEELLKEIHSYLDRLKHQQIITNTTLLQEIKNAVDELFPQSGITQNNVNGPNIGRDQIFTGGTGPMFNGPGAAYYAGVGLPDELNEDIWTKRLMDWLYFPQMDHRESGVKEAHKATFRWALQPREDMNMPGPNLAEWLQNGDGLFWIQGKLGSGKSTLMKYLWQNPLLDQQLRVWAGSRPLYRASFFFWKMGASELQRSLQGLYRTLLSHLIEGEKKLARIAFPRWRTRDADYEATASVLRNALFRILRVSAFPRKYCFFIDGLDEYEEKNPGMQIELANDILSLADIPGIKIVAASRPEVSFMNRFDACPTLKLQDLTANDIKAYVEDEMRPKMRPMQLTVEHRQELSLLATKVVRKAEGVFLWVALVVADIVIGIDQIESYAELHEKLDQMHDDLYTIFKQILLDRIMPNHRQEVARNLLIAHYMPARQHGPISVHAIGQEMGTDPGSAHPDPFDVAETANKALHLSMRLPVRSRALCSVSSPFSHVDLIHSSMYEFLEGEEIQGILQDLAGNFNVYLAISIGMMARMMEVATDYFPSARRKSLNEEAVDLSNSLLLYIEKGMFRSGVLPRYTIECLIRMQEKEWKRFPDFPCLHETLRHTIGGGLTHYLQYQTESLRQLPRTEDRPLLCYALSMRTLHLRAFRDEELDRESIRLGFARVGPLEMLLQHGASPNEVYEEEAVGGDTYGESTPWTDALYLVKNQVDFWYSRSREGLKMFLHALTSAQYMLRYGADPNLGLGGSGISTQIFVDILRKECCPSKSLAECSCCWARDLKPRVTELVKLVEERRLER